MKTGREHIIQKVRAELTVSSKEPHQEKSERLRVAIQDAIQNLDTFLDDLTGESLFKIDVLSVEISLSRNDFDRLEKQIENAVKDKIRVVINDDPVNNKSISEENAEHLSNEKSYREILISFLNTGRLPWWAGVKDMEDAEKWLMDLKADELISLIEPLIQTNPLVVDRLARQFSLSIVHELTQKIVEARLGAGQLIKLQQEILRFMRNYDEPEAVIYELQRNLISGVIRSILTGLSEEKLTEDLFMSALKRFMKTGLEQVDSQQIITKLREWLKSSDQPESQFWVERLDAVKGRENWFEDRKKGEVIPRKEDSVSEVQESKTFDEKEGIAVKNAGLVILHPFLGSLFKNLGYVENGEFPNEAAKERAVCLVHHLATGKEVFPEYELQLPKFLCGWPMDLPFNRFLELSNTEKEECRSLLSSCIQHWEALKNTSVDGLRENFLQREGILKREEFGWSLYTEQRTMDLLLDKLPWNLSIIKLKWMDEMLTVHWH